MLTAFPDEQSCIDHLRELRWPDKEFCPYCGDGRIYRFSDRKTFKCGACRQRFSIKVRTIFEDTKLPLRKWFLAIWILTKHPKGIATTMLAKELKVTQKTAWRLLQRLRHAAQTKSFNAPLRASIRPRNTPAARLGLQGTNGMNDKRIPTDKLAGMAFGEALERFAQTDPKDLSTATAETIREGAIERLIAAFEDAAQIDDGGTEFWAATDLQKLLEYSKWDSFLSVIEKAKEACSAAGQNPADHFSEVRKMVPIGSGAEREVLSDVLLTRYACYLVAQNGDSRKKPVAFAQTYFAIQTRRQEIRDEDESQYIPLSEDQKRLMLRDEIIKHNKRLASAAKGCGVVEPLDFAIFQNFGYKGLYGGLDRSGIQRAKGLKSKQNILDHMGSTELAANLFRATQAEDKLRRENIQGKQAANEAHYQVGQKVRKAIADIGGTMPEKLPTAEDIVKVGRRIKKAIANTEKKK
jgi:DNA-damage-inducible protein D